MPHKDHSDDSWDRSEGTLPSASDKAIVVTRLATRLGCCDFCEFEINSIAR